MLGILFLGLETFKRFRRRTRNFTEVRKFKGELPYWTKTVESFNWLVLSLLFGAIVFRLFAMAHAALHPERRIEGAAAIYGVIGTFLIVVPLALLGANFISWIVPPLRRANINAMTGLDISFNASNRGLLQFGAVSIPLGALLLIFATMEPWLV